MTPKCERLVLRRGSELFCGHVHLPVTSSLQIGKNVEVSSRENPGLSYPGSFKTDSVLMTRLKSLETLSNLSTVTHLVHV